MVELIKRTDEFVMVEFEPLIHFTPAAGTELDEQLMFSVPPSNIVVRLMLGVICGFARSTKRQKMFCEGQPPILDRTIQKFREKSAGIYGLITVLLVQ